MAFTFFFRDTQTIEYAVKLMVPEVAGRSRVRIWDAGCAMGPEPYTLAIILAENMGNFAFKNLYIYATDIDDESGQFGRIITDGIYPYGELKRIPPELFEKYFTKIDGDENRYRINDLIRDRVQYSVHNLLSLKPIADGFSLIVCKNVLLHFQQSERIEVIKMYHRSLAENGLFITEHTQKMPDELKHLFTQVVPDAQVFRKVEANA